MGFQTDDFLLNTQTAKKLYPFAANQPIFDYHCHLDPKEIYEDKVFDDIVDIWLGGDHYKWRLMRANGVSEYYITGNASKKEKFEQWALTLSKAWGNPLYHWSHLEMKQIFGVDEYITPKNWEQLYERLNATIQKEQLSPRKLIKRANVAFIGTTDHPLDELTWHKKIREDDQFHTIVAPTFRPDEAFVEHANFTTFVKKLAQKTNQSVDSFNEFMVAMEQRIRYFVELGCCASDISFTKILFSSVTTEEMDLIFNKAMNKETLTEQEVAKWQTGVFRELCRLYKQYGLVTQVHFGALRNNHQLYYKKLGGDTGFDSMGDQTNLALNLNLFLNDLVEHSSLPKMIFYNLNPMYNVEVANTLANFQANEEQIAGQLQFGAAWWFGDTETGMVSQMIALAEQGLLANFVGMLTDSRSFLSYQRHDYFRRILVAMVGDWVESGRIPQDDELLQEFIENIAFNNAKNYFERN